ncbi:MAG: hypothetical protein H0V24_17195 [Chloroflexia bacterium]|nr:hypothetical protein [Chloroflexia bacterium]
MINIKDRPKRRFDRYRAPLTVDEARAMFDRRARRELGISGEEFLRRWDAGEFQPIPDTPAGWKVGRLYMMMPLVRPTKF